MTRFCNYCDREVDAFLPYRSDTPGMADILRGLSIVGSDVVNHSCPNCGSTDRERHLKLYCEVLGLLHEQMRILHFAPEPRFVGFLSDFAPRFHILADVAPSSPNFEQIDIESIPYPDGSLDLVVANHVLEHVRDPRKALREINRVLGTDGIAILQTPFSGTIEQTQEDSAAGTPRQRLEKYGQEDHLRLFGKDIFTLFAEHLQPDVHDHDDVLGKQTAFTYGVNPHEPLFLYRKRHCETPPARARRVFPGSAEPVISVVCPTYRHASFIGDALASIAGQDTSFPFEIIVSDDHSPDGTAEIVERFARHSPIRVTLHRQPRNVGMHRNVAAALRQAKGRYIAICEGDDYWTDTGKLQKQVEVLESEPETVITYGAVNSIVAGRGNQLDYLYVGGFKGDLSPDELRCATPLNTMTCTFRNVLPGLPPEFFMAGTPDLFLWSMLGWHGGGRYVRSILPSIYRQHSEGVFSTTSLGQRLVLDLMTSYSLHLYYGRIGEGPLAAYFFKRSVERAEAVAGGNDPGALSSLAGAAARMASMVPDTHSAEIHALEGLIDVATRRLRKTPAGEKPT